MAPDALNYGLQSSHAAHWLLNHPKMSQGMGHVQKINESLDEEVRQQDGSAAGVPDRGLLAPLRASPRPRLQFIVGSAFMDAR